LVCAVAVFTGQAVTISATKATDAIPDFTY